MFFRGFREGIFECCSPASFGKPEFLIQEQHISGREKTNLVDSASGGLQLYFQKWQSDRHQHVRSVVFMHHGETDHGGWYNALGVRLAAVGCTSFVHDMQGFGQSDGVRGYFESLEDLVCDFVKFVKIKWAEVLDAQSKTLGGFRPGFVLLGKGIGALVVMRALIELSELANSWGVTASVVLVSPAFQYASFINEQSNVSCGLNSGQCARQPAAQCARAPVAFTPVGEDTSHQKLEHMSRWFPKMIVTTPVDPDMTSRDPDTAERMCRDVLCWRQGYRARVLSEIVHEQSELPNLLAERSDIFSVSPALILHGSGDKLYSAIGSHSLHSQWCDLARASGVYPRLKIYDGAFHQLLNEPNREEVMNDIAHFVASKAPC
mmetsp:Transcript_51725/g.168105  ORF Transcript_51725/g.168105 Transcript_51725/m.168105 type:complete len:377 (+) Transcript_51725:113-1243(+)